MKKTASKKMTPGMKAVAKHEKAEKKSGHEKIEKKLEKEGYMKSGGKMKKKY